MRKILAIFLVFFSILHTTFYILLRPVYADELEEITKKLEELNKAREMSIAATKPLEGTLEKLNADLNNIIARIDIVEADLVKKKKKIDQGEEKLGEQEELLAKRVRSFYIRRSQINPLVIVFSKKTPGVWLRELAYQQAATNEDKRVITEIVLYIKDLEQKKKELENENLRLEAVKKETDKQAAFFKKEIAGAKAYQEKLTTEIASLTAKQQQLLAAKTGSFTTSVGDVPLADDPASRPDYDPGFSPAFAAFSFGAPHRKGMSQYGAYGRAKAGQSAEQILQAYYWAYGGLELKKDYSTSVNIHVVGQGDRYYDENVDIETYVKRIYEVPNQWGEEGGMEALKTQAVAARSYALASTNEGNGTICPSESCQVYKGANKEGKWSEAVEQTKGWVLIKDGKPFSAWYASTSGGYNTPSGWDTSCGNQSCWTNEAYEKKAGSPWFYKAWYKSRSGETCGRSHPWLNNEEMSDIINAIIVSKNNSDGASHIFPVDINSCFGRNEDVWSRDKMREEAGKYGGAVTNTSSISVSYNTGGYTDRVTLQTNRGELSFGGEEFRTIFNLRVPGRLFLASALYNFEKK